MSEPRRYLQTRDAFILSAKIFAATAAHPGRFARQRFEQIVGIFMPPTVGDDTVLSAHPVRFQHMINMS